MPEKACPGNGARVLRSAQRSVIEEPAVPSTASRLHQQLNQNSTPYQDPLGRLAWDGLDADGWWLPKAAISLAGLEVFETQPEVLQRRLSRLEFLGFVDAGLWLEGIFMERIAKSLSAHGTIADRMYHLHELREEAGHSLMFLQLMEKSGLHLPREHVSRPWLVDLLGRRLPPRGALFWLSVVIGEEVPDRLNRAIRVLGAQTVDPLVRQMCTLHVIDEARHAAHARDALERVVGRMHPARRRLLTPLVDVLIRRFLDTFYLPCAAVYELAGLTPGSHWRALARRNPARRAFVLECVNPTLNYLRRLDFPVAAPRF